MNKHDEVSNQIQIWKDVEHWDEKFTDGTEEELKESFRKNGLSDKIIDLLLSVYKKTLNMGGKVLPVGRVIIGSVKKLLEMGFDISSAISIVSAVFSCLLPNLELLEPLSQVIGELREKDSVVDVGKESYWNKTKRWMVKGGILGGTAAKIFGAKTICAFGVTLSIPASPLILAGGIAGGAAAVGLYIFVSLWLKSMGVHTDEARVINTVREGSVYKMLFCRKGK